jgi:hypothetical protein
MVELVIVIVLLEKRALAMPPPSNPRAILPAMVQESIVAVAPLLFVMPPPVNSAVLFVIVQNSALNFPPLSFRMPPP